MVDDELLETMERFAGQIQRFGVDQGSRDAVQTAKAIRAIIDMKARVDSMQSLIRKARRQALVLGGYVGFVAGFFVASAVWLHA